MVRVVQDRSGGIHALISTLGEHWGAVQRDLIDRGLTYDDSLGAEDGRSLSFAELCTWVAYAPPASAIAHARTEGWTRAEHLAAATLDVANALLWMKTEDATKPLELQQHRPQPTDRPGLVHVESKPDTEQLTAESYLNLAGYTVIDWGEGGD